MNPTLGLRSRQLYACGLANFDFHTIISVIGNWSVVQDEMVFPLAAYGFDGDDLGIVIHGGKSFDQTRRVGEVQDSSSREKFRICEPMICRFQCVTAGKMMQYRRKWPSMQQMKASAWNVKKVW